ncbi:hypothetical protein [Lacinutrix sp.]|uniref:hypothetical protein n=1 Tax=Lacinutrix sp. TaxID=1937692 RepID=UPI0026046EBA|nr:hypothetical protein [Lacinutrix sp.]MDG1714752.1 hypothetical protein [Lacinutrix sp.]
MKKIFTFCFFAFALLIGTQSVIAQDMAKINESAIVKAKELRSMLKFNDNKVEEIYNAYQAYESKLYSIKKHLTSGTSEYNDAILKVNQILQSSIKETLGDDLYKRYLIATKQEELLENVQD